MRPGWRWVRCHGALVAAPVFGMRDHRTRSPAEADETLQGCPADRQAADGIGQALQQSRHAKGQEDEDAELDGADPPGSLGCRARPSHASQPCAPGEGNG